MRLLLFVFLFSGLGLSQSIKIPLFVTDGDNELSVHLGIDPNGTDGYDVGLDILAPPPPPSGAFDVRFTHQNEDYFQDIRDINNAENEYLLKYQTTENRSIILYWNPDSLGKYGEFKILDSYSGDYYTLDMLTVDSLNTSSENILQSSLKIIFNPILTSIPGKYYNRELEEVQISSWPNPFNSSTTIYFKVIHSSVYTIELYNVKGQKIKQLAENYYSAGSFSYNLDASSFGSGCYFCIIKSDKEYKAIKILNIQ